MFASFKKLTAKTEYFYKVDNVISLSSSSFNNCLNGFNMEVSVYKFKKTTERLGKEHKSEVTKVRKVDSEEWNAKGGKVCPYVFNESGINIIKFCNSYSASDFNFTLKINDKVITEEKNVPISNINRFFTKQNEKTIEYEKTLKESKESKESHIDEMVDRVMKMGS